MSVINQIRTWSQEELEDISLKCYKEDRKCPENFYNWYHSIINFGDFKHVNILANQIFSYEEVQEMQKTDHIDKVDFEKLNIILKPTLDLLEDNKLYNIKNGCFSNKFDFSTCVTTKQDLAKNLWKINYMSYFYDTGGYTELVVREYLDFDKTTTPTIYNGMPLNEEVRVFYNMDTKEIEYFVDYWDYDYCRLSLHNKTDEIVFDWFHNKIPGRLVNHQYVYEQCCNYIKQHIKSLTFNNTLHGVWSIDFMFKVDISNFELEAYLIDMARGERSAYWDKGKLRKGGQENEYKKS